MQKGFVDSRTVESIDECEFYHTMDLPGHGTVQGQWDLRGRFGEYSGHIEFSGRSVLDVGTASGFLSFEMERLGADVVSFDADCAERFAFVPFPNRPYTEDPERWRKDTNAFLDRLHNSYWFAHGLYGSKAKAFYGDVYDLPEELGQFDVVLVGQILIHLRDPVTALASIARRCSDTLVVTEGLLEIEEPIARLGASTDGGPEWLWWHCSVGLIRNLLAISGFQVVNVYRARFPCNHELMRGEIPLVTVVARRAGLQPAANEHLIERMRTAFVKRFERVRAAWRTLRSGHPWSS